MKNVTVLVLILLGLVAIGCSTVHVKDVKNESFIGKTVTISGTAKNTIKIGSLSGFSLQDSNGDAIGVKSDTLPKEGTEVTVKGVVIRDSIFGYYIAADAVH